LSVVVTMLLGLRLFGAAGLDPERPLAVEVDVSQRVDEYVRAEMAKAHIPGLALAVIRNGTIVKAEGYGLANVDLKLPVTPDTIFQSGSMGKQFTAVAIMMLVEERRIDLDDRLTKYFPEAPSWNPIKVRNLLNHTSGLTEYLLNDRVDIHKNYTPDQLLTIIELFPLEFRPGENCAYRNTNYALLGYIIEKVTGRPWNAFVEERIFEPLGMTSTDVIGKAKNVPHRAIGYLLAGRSLKKPDRVAPIFDNRADGDLQFTVLDLAKWDAALYTERLLKKPTLEQMWTIGTLNNGRPLPNENYGFGWYVETMNGHKLVEHGGYTWGFRTHMSRYLDHKLSVVVLTNLEWLYAQPNRIAHVVAGMYEPSLARPTSKIPDEPQITELVRDLIRKLRAGKPVEGWTQSEVRRFQRYLRGLKPLTSLELVHREDKGDRRFYTYRLNLGDFDCLFQARLNSQNRVVGMTLPVD